MQPVIRADGLIYLYNIMRNRICHIFLPGAFIALFLPCMLYAQTAGMISRSQCVISGGTPSAFTSVSNRDASGGTITWQKSTDAAFTSPVTVASNTQTYSEGAVTADTYYRRVVNGNIYSNVIKVSVVGSTTSPQFIPTGVSSICAGATSLSVSFTTVASPTKYSIIWDANPSSLGFVDVVEQNLSASPLSVSIVSTAAAGTYTGTLIPLAANGCSAAGTQAPFTLKAVPVVSVSAGGPLSFCTGGSVTLTASGGATYQWSNGSTASAVSLNSSGTYTVTATTNGCSATSTGTTVTVNALPVASISPAGSISTCAGTPVSLTASGGSTYQWNSGQTGSVVSTATAGTYTVTVTDANNCSATSSATVLSINPLPSVSIAAGGPLSFCAGGSVTLTASGGSTYRWSTGSILTAISVVSGGSYTVTATSAQNCSATSSATIVTVNPLPLVSVAVGGPLSFCAGGSVTLTASGGNTYRWNTGSTLAAISVVNSGTYTVTATSAQNCSSTSSGTLVSVNPLPVLTITTPAAVCAPATVNLQSASVTSGSSTGTVLSYWTDANATTALATPAAVSTTGTYYIKSVFSSTGCSRIQPVTVSVQPLPVLQVTSPPAVCEPGTVNITTSSVVTNGTTGAVISYWRDAAYTQAVTQPAAISQSGVYYVKSTSTGGCTNSLPVTVTVHPLPRGSLQTPALTYICAGSTQTLVASGADNYQWYRNRQQISGITGTQLQVDEAGVYTVRFRSAAGCEADAPNTISLDLLQRPVASFRISNRCIDTSIVFTNTSVVANTGIVNWSWDFGDGSVSTERNPSHIYNSAGAYNISLTADPVACPSLRTQYSIGYNFEKTRAAVRYDTIYTVGGKNFVLTARSFGQQFSWQPVTGLTLPTSFSTNGSLNSDQEYIVGIGTTAGCITYDTVYVKIRNDGAIYVPQGFTPNGDGNNDRLYPNLAGIRQLLYFKVYNRWGNQVFQTTDASPQGGWDGTYLGNKQPPGTYTWTAAGIDGNGNTIRMSGTVLLIL
jgi:gliding motility-associated-like protein